MSEADLKKRTKAFALRILKLVDALPKTTAGRALASQIVRSGTSVAANYRNRSSRSAIRIPNSAFE